MDNQNAKLKSKLYVKLLTKFSNMPIKWPLKILLGGDGSVLQHGINGCLQKKDKWILNILFDNCKFSNFKAKPHSVLTEKSKRKAERKWKWSEKISPSNTFNLIKFHPD